MKRHWKEFIQLVVLCAMLLVACGCNSSTTNGKNSANASNGTSTPNVANIVDPYGLFQGKFPAGTCPTQKPQDGKTKSFHLGFIQDLNGDTSADPHPQEQSRLKITKQWLVCNNGTLAWPSGMEIVSALQEIHPNPGVTPIEILNSKVPQLKPGQIGEIEVTVVTPQQAGEYLQWYGVSQSNGLALFDLVSLDVVVSGSSTPKTSGTPDYGTTAQAVATATGTSQNPSVNWVQVYKSPCIQNSNNIICDHLQFRSHKQLSIETSGGIGELTIVIDQPQGQPGSTFIGTFQVLEPNKTIDVPANKIVGIRTIWFYISGKFKITRFRSILN